MNGTQLIAIFLLFTVLGFLTIWGLSKIDKEDLRTLALALGIGTAVMTTGASIFYLIHVACMGSWSEFWTG